MQNGQPGQAMRLPGVVKGKDTYNAYFSKRADYTLWLTGTSKETPRYVAYTPGELPEAAVPAPVELLVSAPVEEAVSEPIVAKAPEQKAEAVSETPTVKSPVRTTAPSLVLYNEFNRVHLSLHELSGLSRFLRQQPDRATFVIKGYSDGYGEPAAKQRVSEQRARSVKAYIERYFASKGFQVKTEGEVPPGKGKAHRKTELYLLQ